MSKPLALKMAPVSIKDVIGQKHLVGENKILYNFLRLLFLFLKLHKSIIISRFFTSRYMIKLSRKIR